MIHNFDKIEDQLKRLAPTINAFKSEAVQLKIIDLIFGSSLPELPEEPKGEKKSKGAEQDNSKKKRSKSSKKSKKKTSKSVTKSSSRPGPGKIVDTLIAEGFFKKSRGPADIVTHCKDNKVLTYNNSEISVSLGRAVKSGKLKREKNEEGQFGYSIP